MPLLKSKFLEKTSKEVRIGDRCEQIKPNVFEDCILQEGEEVIGFYINDLSKYSPKMIRGLMPLAVRFTQLIRRKRS